METVACKNDSSVFLDDLKLYIFGRLQNPIRDVLDPPWRMRASNTCYSRNHLLITVPNQLAIINLWYYFLSLNSQTEGMEDLKRSFVDFKLRTVNCSLILSEKSSGKVTKNFSRGNNSCSEQQRYRARDGIDLEKTTPRACTFQVIAHIGKYDTTYT